MKHLVLVGFMASGKSTLASLLSPSLNLPIFSTDLWIEFQTQKSVAEIFSLYGESEFRLWEKRAYEEILELQETHIIDCGGGFVLGNDVRELGRVYYLQAGLEEIQRRLQSKQEEIKRPLAKKIGELYFQRERVYQSLASKVVLGERGEGLEEILEDWKSFNALLPTLLLQDKHK